MPTQEWYIHAHRFGPFPIGLTITRVQAHVPDSYAWFCQSCGDVWARRIVRDAEGNITPWHVWNNPCERCVGDLRTPGSIYLFGDPEYLKTIPHKLLLRELSITTENL